MSEFLTSLALRSAGNLTIAVPEPSASWPEQVAMPADDGTIAVEFGAAPADQKVPLSEVDSQPRHSPPRPAREMHDGPTPPFAIPRSQPVAEAMPAAENRIEREILSTRLELPPDAGKPAPPVEIREVVRQTEVVRETIFERSSPLQEGDQPQLPFRAQPQVPPFSLPTSPMAPREVTHEGIGPKAAAPSVMLSPVPPPSVLSPRRVAEQSVNPIQPVVITSQQKNTPALRSSEPIPSVTARPTSEPASRGDDSPAPPARPAPAREVRDEERSVVPPPVPRLTPAKPEPPVVTAAEPPRRTPPVDQRVEVKIGTIEFRAPPALAGAPSTPEPAHVPIDAADGLASYLALRRYTAWYRE